MLTNKERDMHRVHEQRELENHHQKMNDAISNGEYTPQPDRWCDNCAEETAPTVGLAPPENDPECSACGWDYIEDLEVRCDTMEKASTKLHKLLRAKNKEIGDLARENTALTQSMEITTTALQGTFQRIGDLTEENIEVKESTELSWLTEVTRLNEALDEMTKENAALKNACEEKDDTIKRLRAAMDEDRSNCDKLLEAAIKSADASRKELEHWGY